MSGVHPTAAVGFDRGAADYEYGRPGYPRAAVEIPARELGLGPASTIVDLAAGTGKLTRELAGLGVAKLIAVEPVPGMRLQLERAVPGVAMLDATAERLGLADASVDAVFVAQAIQWFDVSAAAVEIHRVLRPGGGIVLVRNEWDETLAWVEAVRQLVRRDRPEELKAPSPDWREQLEATGLFEPLDERILPHPVPTTTESLVARMASMSWIAALPEVEREDVLERIRRIPGEHGLTKEFATPYLTHVLWARRLG